MSQCLVVPRSDVERMSFWGDLERVNGQVKTAIRLTQEQIQEFLHLVEEHKSFRERRGDDGVENQPEWQQVILYGLITRGEEFFVYQRGGEASKYEEKRLAAQISAGVGGHIEPFDTGLLNSLYREIDEELVFSRNSREVNLKRGDGTVNLDRFAKIAELSLVGLVKDDTALVHEVHIGLICRFRLIDPGVGVAIRGEVGGENIEGGMLNLSGYRSWIGQDGFAPENWTDLMVENIVAQPGFLSLEGTPPRKERK